MGRTVEAKRRSRRIQKQKRRNFKKLRLSKQLSESSHFELSIGTSFENESSGNHSPISLHASVPRQSGSILPQIQALSTALLTKNDSNCSNLASLHSIQQKQKLDTVSCVSEQSSDYVSEISSFGTPGSPPPTPTSESEIETSDSEDKSGYEAAHSVHDKLHSVTERMKLYYRKIQEQEIIIEDHQENTQTLVNRVRDFWRNKIYLEGSWSGKIVKMSMQKHDVRT